MTIPAFISPTPFKMIHVTLPEVLVCVFRTPTLMVQPGARKEGEKPSTTLSSDES